MKHIMVDLETLSVRPTAAILSIGAVKFELEDGHIGDEFYAPVQMQSCIDFGLTIDGNTLSFWAQQPEPSRQVMWDSHAEHLSTVLVAFRAWAIDDPVPHLWGNGAAFDNVILRNAFRVCQLSYPFDHRTDMCYRTLRKLYKLKFDDNSKTDKPHNALEDARMQASRAIMMWKRLKI